MADLSSFLQTKILNAIFKGGTLSIPSCFLSLHTEGAATDAAWAGTEIVELGYARIELGSTAWTSPVDGFISNVDAIEFGLAGEDWGTVSHLGLWDAATGGNLLYSGEMAVPRVVSNGDIARFSPGLLTVQMS